MKARWKGYFNHRSEKGGRNSIARNVSAQDYPAIFVKTALNDSQVMYWEPAKWVAKLRALKTDSNPLVFRTDMGAGHGGASGRYDYLREVAEEYAFILWQAGKHTA